ncbi:MAG: hypothetical protein J2P37_17060, partial [Ktedonobacteraceae bacterium]|nr:hypothetical protein [Ktedonobacteraceae bacterium]
SHWRRGIASWSPEERRDVVRYCVHLALLLGAAITLVLYILSPNSALYPVATSRYLIGSLLVTPALLWPLWDGLWSAGPRVAEGESRRAREMAAQSRPPTRGGPTFLARQGILLLVGVIFLLGTFSTFTGIPAEASVPGEDIYFTQNSTQHLDVPATQELNQRESQLIDYLSRVGDIHIYSDYWTCNRLIFKSQEHIICDVLNDDLRPGHDRYLPYRALVNADPRAAYVLREGSQQDRLFQQQRMQRGYRRFVLAGYAIFERNL